MENSFLELCTSEILNARFPPCLTYSLPWNKPKLSEKLDLLSELPSCYTVLTSQLQLRLVTLDLPVYRCTVPDLVTVTRLDPEPDLFWLHGWPSDLQEHYGLSWWSGFQADPTSFSHPCPARYGIVLGSQFPVPSSFVSQSHKLSQKGLGYE